MADRKPRLVRSPYNYDVDVVSDATGVSSGEPTLTQQQFAEEVNINTLVRRFHLTGEMPKDVRPVTYGDFAEVFDFHSAANAIAAAHESFERMPAELRFSKFGNDPAKFVAWCSDDANLEEARKLGLAVPARAAPVPSTDGAPAPVGAPTGTGGGGEGSSAPQGGAPAS